MTLTVGTSVARLLLLGGHDGGGGEQDRSAGAVSRSARGRRQCRSRWTRSQLAAAAGVRWRIRCTTTTPAARRARIPTATPMGRPGPLPELEPVVLDAAEAPVAGKGAPTHGGFFRAGERARDGREAERDGGRRGDVDGHYVAVPREADVLGARGWAGRDGQRAPRRGGWDAEPVEGVEDAVVVARRTGRGEGGRTGGAGDRRAAGRGEGQPVSGQRSEAREEVARVRLTVGDGGIRRLEPDDQKGLRRVARRRTRAVGDEPGQGGARDLVVVGGRVPVRRVGEVEAEGRGRRPSDGGSARVPIENGRTRWQAFERPEVERLAEAGLGEDEVHIVRSRGYGGHEAVGAGRAGGPARCPRRSPG